MNAPRQWINTDQKEDPKKLHLVNCSTHVTIVLVKKLKQTTY